MGTSSSSSGPGAGVPFDPPWLSSVASEIGSPLEQISGDGAQQEQTPQQAEPVVQPSGIAPPRRFGNARRYMGEYASGGDRAALKKSLGSYSRKGMGGASNVASRMKTSTSAGAGLFNFLQGVRDSSDAGVRDWVNQLTSKNLSAYEVADQIIDQVISTGGSIEEESCRDSMAQAMSELLTINPDINLVNMDNDSIWTVLELFMANEAFNRINLDIGQLFESAKYSPREAVSRMNEMRDYLKSEISAQMQELRKDTSNPTKAEMNALLQAAIKITFEVFEEEI
ncbi:Qat anti-phage system associated protein QatB [Oleidesulfovibrio alaskensis]|uniref:Qat anti-phage system associated protein QatB n=1 Tax=Oleidesulfovibrio alaskensis TaxID=58180 RepID=UPI001A5884D0|nr:Qat anti-phage system associated protein QatB [Oleidesulfovibrio alaskensis]MBL3581662.1 hypothetical protein [Oleidesulfovibrio alaskensis]MBL3588141.1 hypothetical protein [bacterium]